jgi:hypothetical protein
MVIDLMRMVMRFGSGPGNGGFAGFWVVAPEIWRQVDSVRGVNGPAPGVITAVSSIGGADDVGDGG